MTRAYLECYRITLDAAANLSAPCDRRALVRVALEKGRAAYLAGRIALSESLSRGTVENASEWLVQRGALPNASEGKQVQPGPEQTHLADAVKQIDRHLST